MKKSAAAMVPAYARRKVHQDLARPGDAADRVSLQGLRDRRPGDAVDPAGDAISALGMRSRSWTARRARGCSRQFHEPLHVFEKVWGAMGRRNAMAITLIAESTARYMAGDAISPVARIIQVLTIGAVPPNIARVML